MRFVRFLLDTGYADARNAVRLGVALVVVVLSAYGVTSPLLTPEVLGAAAATFEAVTLLLRKYVTRQAG